MVLILLVIQSIGVDGPVFELALAQGPLGFFNKNFISFML